MMSLLGVGAADRSAAKVDELNTHHEPRSPGLDTLRGCGVLAIIIFHYLNNTSVFLSPPSLAFLQPWTSNFFLGVDLFFVLSGFLIGGSLMAAKDKPGYFRNYVARRLGRILPLYLLWLAIFVGFLAVDAANRFGGAFLGLMLPEEPLISYLTFTQNFAFAKDSTWGPAWLTVTWSLAVEMHFYAIAAVVIYYLPTRYLGLVSVAIIVVEEIGRQLWGGYLGDHATYILTPTRLDAPFIGVLCAWLWHRDGVRRFLTDHGDLLRYASIIVLVAFDFLWMRSYVRSPLTNYLTFGIFFALAVLPFATPAPRAANAIVRFVRWCGVRCYGIYIIHVGILGLAGHLIFKLPANVFPPGVGWPAVVLATLVTFGLAATSWTYFERPLLTAVIRRFSLPRNAEKVGVVGARPEISSGQAI